MIDQATAEEVEILTPILKRLELAIDDIQHSPVIAADELEIAWKLLIEATEFTVTIPTPEIQPTETTLEEESDGSE